LFLGGLGFSDAYAASSTTVTVIHDASHAPVLNVPLGTTAHDEATVTGDGVTAPTGTVDFAFYSTINCSDTPVASGTGIALVTVGTDGVAHPSTSQGPLTVGSYGFKATYSGDANYSGSVGSCEPLTVFPCEECETKPLFTCDDALAAFIDPTLYPNNNDLVGLGYTVEHMSSGDTFKGTDDPAELTNYFVFGTDSQDIIELRGQGAHFICGFDGNDVIKTGPNTDIVFAGDGDDSVEGGGEADYIDGGKGDDQLYGDQHGSSLNGGDFGKDGADCIFGGEGKDDIEAHGGNDIIDGGAGDDEIDADQGDDIIVGGDGEDDIDAGDGDDRINGGAGVDKINGNSGIDTLGDFDVDIVSNVEFGSDVNIGDTIVLCN